MEYQKEDKQGWYKDGNKGQGVVPSSFCPQSLVGHSHTKKTRLSQPCDNLIVHVEGLLHACDNLASMANNVVTTLYKFYNLVMTM